MARQFDEFRVSRYAEVHMFMDHGVYLDEVVEAAESTPHHKRTYSTREGEIRYVIPGKTLAGRRLWVVVADEGDGVGRVISAYEPHSRRDVARHKHLRGD